RYSTPPRGLPPAPRLRRGGESERDGRSVLPLLVEEGWPEGPGWSAEGRLCELHHPMTPHHPPGLRPDMYPEGAPPRERRGVGAGWPHMLPLPSALPHLPENLHWRCAYDPARAEQAGDQHAETRDQHADDPHPRIHGVRDVQHPR